MTPDARKIYHDSVTAWLGSSYLLAVLPLLARALVGPWTSFEAEGCLFILVLATTGVWEAYLDSKKRHVADAWRNILVALGIISACYGALGYGRLAATTPEHYKDAFQAGILIWPLVIALSATYLAYKLPLLKGEAIGQAQGNVATS